MAQRKPTSERERDFHHPVPVQDDTRNGRQLDEVRLNERENKSVGRDDDKGNHSRKTRNDDHLSELSKVGNVLPNEQLFMSRSESLNEYDELETSTSLPTDGYFDKENESSFGDKCQFIGLRPGTVTKGYPKGTQIVGIHCEICFEKT